MPGLNAHDRLKEYGAMFHTCAQSTVTLTNHAIGATSCLFAEKCIAQRVSDGCGFMTQAKSGLGVRAQGLLVQAAAAALGV